MTRRGEGRGDSVDNGPGAGGNRVHQRTECGQSLVRERLGRGRGRDLQAEMRILACSDSTGKPVVGYKQGCDNQICIWRGSLWHQCGQWGQRWTWGDW